MKQLGFILAFILAFSIHNFGQSIKEVNGVYLTPESKPYSGHYTSAYENGNIKMEMYLKKGMKEGQVKIYFPDGILNEIRSFRKNQMHGTWLVYNEKGMKTSLANYHKGKKDGKWMIWNDSGQLIYDLQYTKGEKTGIWKIYDESGKLINERDYSANKK